MNGTNPPKTVRVRIKSTFERMMALLVLLNYILVIFDLTYIPLRDFWLQGRLQITLIRFNEPVQLGPISFQEIQIPPKEPLEVPFVTVLSKYDPVKGIKPYRNTVEYLGAVAELERLVQLSSSPLARGDINEYNRIQTAIDSVLAKLRQDSVNMIDTNPFQLAGKTGTLEKIKNRVRVRVTGTENASAKGAFNEFWSRDYLTRKGFENELGFFNKEIKPLIETNYYRPTGEDGRPIDNFEAIDFFFGIIFFTEFLARTWWLSRNRVGLKWFEAMLWRWYDIFLFVPFARYLRIIPLFVRLDKSGLVDFTIVKQQATQGFVASISGEITEVIVVRVINQIQGYIRRGEIEKFLDHQNNLIDLNDTNEVVEIVKLMLSITVQNVLPEIKPEVELFIKYNIDNAIKESPFSQNIQQLPGMREMQERMIDRIVSRTYESFLTLAAELTKKDEVREELMENLIDKFGISLKNQLQSRHSLERLENLIIALLEEIKINYIKTLTDEDMEIILEQSRNLKNKNAGSDLRSALVRKNND